MRAYLWTMLVLLVLEALGRALWISHGWYPKRTPGATVFDLIAGLCLAGWAAYLLMAGEITHG